MSNPVHPATNLFPMLGEDAIAALVQDIQNNGLIEPVWLYDDPERGTVLLDGRNREKACEAAGVKLETRMYQGDDPVGFVVSANVRRRQLTSGQLALLALDVEKLFAEDAAKRRAQASGQPRGTKSLVAELPQQKSRERAAQAVGCKARVVGQAKRVLKEAPDLAEQVRAGTMATDKAHRIVQEREKRARVKELDTAPTPLMPTTQYRTIVIDLPWQYDNTASHGAAARHYPTMTFEELKRLEVPATDEAHLYLWVTNTFVRMGHDLLDAWGFEYKTMLTWVKPVMGLGSYFRNNTEHVLFAVKGGLPTMSNTVCTSFTAPRTKHSAKPDEFCDIVEAASPGPYLDMFARRDHPGWTTWGKEAAPARATA